MRDDTNGELVERRLGYENGEAQQFYRALPKPVRIGVEATGPLQWFDRLRSQSSGEMRVTECIAAKNCPRERTIPSAMQHVHRIQERTEFVSTRRTAPDRRNNTRFSGGAPRSWDILQQQAQPGRNLNYWALWPAINSDVNHCEEDSC